MPNGHLLLTESGTKSAAEIDLASGRVLSYAPLPVAYPSDTQPTRKPPTFGLTFGTGKGRVTPAGAC